MTVRVYVCVCVCVCVCGDGNAFHNHVHFTLSHVGCTPLPWRLSPTALEEVDSRVLKIIYPRGTNGCSKEGVSFFKKSGRTWRTSEKLLALLRIMPTALRGYVPTVRATLRHLVWGLRILEGRCISESEAKSLNVEPGSSPLSDKDIKKAKPLIIEGLSEMEG